MSKKKRATTKRSITAGPCHQRHFSRNPTDQQWDNLEQILRQPIPPDARKTLNGATEIYARTLPINYKDEVDPKKDKIRAAGKVSSELQDWRIRTSKTRAFIWIDDQKNTRHLSKESVIAKAKNWTKTAIVHHPLRFAAEMMDIANAAAGYAIEKINGREFDGMAERQIYLLWLTSVVKILRKYKLEITTRNARGQLIKQEFLDFLDRFKDIALAQARPRTGTRESMMKTLQEAREIFGDASCQTCLWLLAVTCSP